MRVDFRVDGPPVIRGPRVRISFDALRPRVKPICMEHWMFNPKTGEAKLLYVERTKKRDRNEIRFS